MIEKIVLAGGSGFIGESLAHYYKDKCKEIVILSRGKGSSLKWVKNVRWNGKDRGSWTEQLENCNILINLSGKNINCRHTRINKEKIILSRVQPTIALGNAIPTLKNPPKLWINFSAATIYKSVQDQTIDEYNGKEGHDFSAEVCKKWEAAFNEQIIKNTRKVVLRIPIVLGNKDGVLPRFKKIVQWGMGGKQGNGEQFFSWVHEKDLMRIIDFIYESNDCEGAFNCSSPYPLKNVEMMKTLRSSLHVPIGLPARKWMLEIGALLIGTEAELILSNSRVVPTRLLEKGFKFQFEKFQLAIDDLLNTPS